MIVFPFLITAIARREPVSLTLPALPVGFSCHGEGAEFGNVDLSLPVYRGGEVPLDSPPHGDQDLVPRTDDVIRGDWEGRQGGELSLLPCENVVSEMHERIDLVVPEAGQKEIPQVA
jgi:hypothetical protein